MPGDKRTSDPKALRALAHSLRWQLVDLLGSEGSATATRCARAISESAGRLARTSRAAKELPRCHA